MERVPGLNQSFDFVGIESMYLTHPQTKLALISIAYTHPKIQHLYHLISITYERKFQSFKKTYGDWAAQHLSGKNRVTELFPDLLHISLPRKGGKILGHWKCKHRGIYVKCLIHSVCCKTWCMCHMYVYSLYEIMVIPTNGTGCLYSSCLQSRCFHHFNAAFTTPALQPHSLPLFEEQCWLLWWHPAPWLPSHHISQQFLPSTPNLAKWKVPPLFCSMDIWDVSQLKYSADMQSRLQITHSRNSVRQFEQHGVHLRDWHTFTPES